MAFSLSPGVSFTEKDLTQFIAGTSTSTGGLVGDFSWGPISEVVNISSEELLIEKFSTPNDKNYKDWFTAANFLAYSTGLKLVRASDASDSSRNARMYGSLSSEPGVSPVLIKNLQEFEDSAKATEVATGNFGVPFVARYGGVLGNTISVAYAGPSEFSTFGYKSKFAVKPKNFELCVVVLVGGEIAETFTVSTKPGYKDGYGLNNYIDDVINAQSQYLYSFAHNLQKPLFVKASAGGVSGVLSDALTTDGTTGAVSVVGNTATFTLNTGVAALAGDMVGTKLKVISGVNAGKVFNIMSSTLSGNTYSIVLDQFATAQDLDVLSESVVEENRFVATGGDATRIGGVESFSGGIDVGVIVPADVISGWSLMDTAEEVDVSLLMEGAGDAGKLIANHLIQNVAEERKDCVAFISPTLSDLLNSATPVTNLIESRNKMPSSSYAFMDGNYKYQYDRYNDTYRWVPFNGDIAGLAARTDQSNDAWWSFAGYNRGIIKNVTKVAFTNSKKSQRDDLYQSQINPIVQEAGSGTLLLGDKTMQTLDSAFSFINVRRLFITLEKAIANAAKYNLFEFNDEFTRARFVQMVTPFLRDVQGRRGITEFEVIADTTVNTPQVINSAEFRSTIKIRPNRSINFINLTFTAVAEGVSFDEVVA